MNRIAKRLTTALVVGTVVAGSAPMLVSTALATSPMYSTLITEGTCKYDMFHEHNSSSAHADTENKGGCSEVAARIGYNSTTTAWSYHVTKAQVNISLTPLTFQWSAAKAYQTGVGYHSTWYLNG